MQLEVRVCRRKAFMDDILLEIFHSGDTGVALVC